MTRHSRVLSTVLAGALWLASSAAQEAPPAREELVGATPAAAIDRGLRAFDPPLAPRGGDDDPREQFAGDDPPYLPGSLIVKFRPGTSIAARGSLLALVDGVATPPLSYADFDVVAIGADADPEAAARQLAAQPDVQYAQARYVMRPQFVPNDPFYSRQWNFPVLDMERAWDLNPGASSDIVVAVLDSGVAYRSTVVRYNAAAFRLNTVLFPALGAVDVPFQAAPDLGGAERFVAPRDFIWEDELPLDLSGHGTHVAGTIGQATNNNLGVAGMAFNVRLMPVKVITDVWDLIFRAPNVGTDDVIARGIRYAVDNGAKVLNMSIGRGGPPAPVVEEALVYATSRGAFVAIAAGNSFQNGNPIQRPADAAPRIAGVVAVGAIARNRARAFYSSTGAYVELTAPGGDQRAHGSEGGVLQQTFDFDRVLTYSRGPALFSPPRFDAFAFQFFQGTSMAAPHVAGFAALLMQHGITSPAAVEAAMTRYATDLGAAGRDDEFGHGLINPRAALRGLGLVR